MSSFVKFTEEEIYQAAHKSIKEFLEAHGEKVRSSGTEWLWDKHDSVKFRGHLWYRHSTNEGGTAIDFLCYFFNMSFPDAVLTLLDCQPLSYHRSESTLEQKVQQDKIILAPQHSKSYSRCIAYLCKARKIDYSVIEYFIKCKMLYESSDYHNVVFVGYDRKRRVRHIAQCGTLDKVRYKNEIAGSDKSYAFNYHCKENVTLYAYESPIDMMSYITMYHTDTFKNNNYTTCCGLSKSPIDRFLKDYPYIKRIVFCFDNDTAGHSTALKYSEFYKSKGYDVDIHKPVNKDFNDDLKEQRRQQ